MFLFDISLCKYKNFQICKCKIKVPIAERAFLTDQRISRRIVIGNVDIKARKMVGSSVKSKEKAAKRSKNAQLQDNEANMVNILSTSYLGQFLESSNSSNENEDTILEYKRFEPKKGVISQDSPSSSQMRTKFPNVALATDRTGVHDRSVLILINTALKGMKVYTKEDSSKVVTKMKRKNKKPHWFEKEKREGRSFIRTCEILWRSNI